MKILNKIVWQKLKLLRFFYKYRFVVFQTTNCTATSDTAVDYYSNRPTIWSVRLKADF